MMKRILLATAAVALLASSAAAQPPAQPQRIIKKEIVRGQQFFLRDMKLSDAQELQMKKLRIDLMKKQTQLRSRIQTLRLDSKELFLAEKIDRKALESNVKAISEAQEQMKLNMVDHFFAVNAMLNAEQQKIWKNHAMQVGEKMRQGVQNRMRGRMRMRLHQDIDGPEENF